MGPSRVGFLWCFGFILPEAIQSVFFGRVFQTMDSFLIGGLVFAITTLAAMIWVKARTPEQLSIACRNPKELIGVNVTVALAWIAYLLSVQLIEPVVAFTIFSGAVPLTTLLASRLGVEDADGPRNGMEAIAIASPLTIGAVSALGPFLVFIFQWIEGRVDYAPATLAGLIVYFVGAVLATCGAGSVNHDPEPSSP